MSFMPRCAALCCGDLAGGMLKPGGAWNSCCSSWAYMQRLSVTTTETISCARRTNVSTRQLSTRNASLLQAQVRTTMPCVEIAHVSSGGGTVSC